MTYEDALLSAKARSKKLKGRSVWDIFCFYTTSTKRFGVFRWGRNDQAMKAAKPGEHLEIAARYSNYVAFQQVEIVRPELLPADAEGYIT